MGLGPVMLDVLGTRLTVEDEARLMHPLVGGVILFKRNYESPAQLAELTAAIHALRTTPLLVAVDHEGGRVQRFREGFTPIPPMRELGKIWDSHPQRARHLAHQTGYVLAAELRGCGVDFSFTPVLDVDYGQSCVIGNRAFHSDPQAIAELAHSLLLGLKQGGMHTVGKHFPGHGFVAADSHLAIPVDEREFVDIELCDLQPFRQMISFGLTAVMPAHVIYPKIDSRPAGFSPVWLKDILRGQMGFEGCIFSDDLSMEGATVAGGIVQRASAALHAGCDMVLVCNKPESADALLAGLHWDMPLQSRARIIQMRGQSHSPSLDKLHEQPEFLRALQEVASIGICSPELGLA
ncbi:MAG: beta-N-acetylhexosaminidase [Gallionellales bacterium CG03_land_8_20_14_0_80_55_15]|nr:MAG: beta-N-acetylhexosaminidase [Gallionellales bacterium CG03_land_8_20_14_0_80_55_15]PIX04182.1 MAG: beta-N-acetylhexosaminidase [Gallionellales bacterium CG_4_8_14_3_um_filter_54_18]PJC05046.1 MAG: beta-N-acetylhexosaminidase [Gallionellales bacterium CG_4_9_14_0_8_um_filter_55_61]